MIMGRDAVNAHDIQVPSALPSDSALRALALSDSLSTVTRINAASAMQRPDLFAARARVDVARLELTRQNSTLLPRVNSFARYDWNSPTSLYGGKKNWTLGVVASWSLFNGGQSLAEISAASSRFRAARDAEHVATQQAILDADVTQRAVMVALQRLLNADAQATQSAEAQRLVSRRYAGGLATVAELLAANAMATGAALRHATTRYAVIAAVTSHRLAIGADITSLAALDALPSSTH